MSNADDIVITNDVVKLRAIWREVPVTARVTRSHTARATNLWVIRTMGRKGPVAPRRFRMAIVNTPEFITDKALKTALINIVDVMAIRHNLNITSIHWWGEGRTQWNVD